MVSKYTTATKTVKVPPTISASSFTSKYTEAIAHAATDAELEANDDRKVATVTTQTDVFEIQDENFENGVWRIPEKLMKINR